MSGLFAMVMEADAPTGSLTPRDKVLPHITIAYTGADDHINTHVLVSQGMPFCQHLIGKEFTLESAELNYVSHLDRWDILMVPDEKTIQIIKETQQSLCHEWRYNTVSCFELVHVTFGSYRRKSDAEKWLQVVKKRFPQRMTIIGVCVDC